MDAVAMILLLAVVGFPLGQSLTVRQGGSLQIVQDSRSPREGRIVLKGYSGRPLKALQFELRSEKGIRFAGVAAGSAVNSANAWSLNSTIASAQTPAKREAEDTIRVVLFAKTSAGLSSSSELEILRFTVDGVSNRKGSLRFRLADVLGALESGEEAGIVAGPERTTRFASIRMGAWASFLWLALHRIRPYQFFRRPSTLETWPTMIRRGLSFLSLIPP